MLHSGSITFRFHSHAVVQPRSSCIMRCAIASVTRALATMVSRIVAIIGPVSPLSPCTPAALQMAVLRAADEASSPLCRSAPLLASLMLLARIALDAPLLLLPTLAAFDMLLSPTGEVKAAGVLICTGCKTSVRALLARLPAAAALLAVGVRVGVSTSLLSSSEEETSASLSSSPFLSARALSSAKLALSLRFFAVALTCLPVFAALSIFS